MERPRKRKTHKDGLTSIPTQQDWNEWADKMEAENAALRKVYEKVLLWYQGHRLDPYVHQEAIEVLEDVRMVINFKAIEESEYIRLKQKRMF